MSAVLATVVLAILLVSGVWRRHAADVMERQVTQRFPRWPDGVIRGAEGISLAAGEQAVLLLHGFGDTPQSLRHLAEYLHDAGWTVNVPLLPGHGRSLRDFAASTAAEWASFAQNEYDALRRSHRNVAVIGQSMGGALALSLAADRDVPALVLLAPYLTMLPKVARLARRSRLVSLVAPYVRSRSEASIHDPVERGNSLGYGAVPPRALAELLSVTTAAWNAAPRVRAPTLVMQSDADNRIDAAGATRAFQRIGAAVKELQWLTDRGHVLAVDVGRDEVFARTQDWLRRYGSL